MDVVQHNRSIVAEVDHHIPVHEGADEELQDVVVTGQVELQAVGAQIEVLAPLIAAWRGEDEEIGAGARRSSPSSPKLASSPSPPSTVSSPC